MTWRSLITFVAQLLFGVGLACVGATVILVLCFALSQWAFSVMI